MPLLTIEQQQAIKPMSPNWTSGGKQTGGVDNFTQLATEVEENEARKLLGVTLLQDIQDNPAEARNVTLLEGGSFECGDDTIKFKGLYFVLAYLNFSRYLGESYVSDSFTGFVKKNRSEATTLSEGEIKRLQQSSRELGLAEFELIRQFLNENSEDYPTWKCDRKKIYLPRFQGLRKTRN